MDMLRGRPRRASFILVNKNRSPPLIVLENDQTLSIGPQNFFNLSLTQLGHAQAVFRALDDDLMRADPTQTNVCRIGWSRDVSHVDQSWKFIRYYSDSPTRRISWSRWITIGENFRRGLPFPARAKRTSFVSVGFCRCSISIRTLASFSGDDDPA